ncbi:MAG: isoprenylcysteine carboxylmethyltransferase family protein [Tidjanibacter sp.]|nr:isoprenylcysteine carboxylmethyltransferase family protein [Tidjanibacter sp.]
MKSKLFIEAIVKFLAGVVLIGTLIFLPAGSLHFSNGWLLMAILFIPMFIAGIILIAKNPSLLQKRLQAKEQEGEQRKVVALSGLLFIASFITSGLNWRYGWSTLPEWCVWTAVGLFLASYLLYAEVLRENTYLSRTIEVQEGQRVIDKGLYGIVRHPMYSATILLFLSMPLVLGSLPSFVLMLLYIPIIAKRIRNEEEVLTQGLEGYKEYTERVRYRLLPFIW